MSAASYIFNIVRQISDYYMIVMLFCSLLSIHVTASIENYSENI